MWRALLNGSRIRFSDADINALADRFRFTEGQIRDAVTDARNRARWRDPFEPRISVADLYAASRAQSGQTLGTLASKLVPRYTWEDIILPSESFRQLREIYYRASYHNVVYGDWGFDRKLSGGKGLNALFAGPSGTGKTMAAEVIAHALGLELYRIDLSAVVSKYIGETEKNLARVFDAATSSNAILFFDEADALFGKRSEVKDAHDRYANIEISYLLQRMEEYEGVSVLATNLRRNMDEAFVRRMASVVSFPLPEEEQRRVIWERIWPSTAPLAADVEIDFMARQFKVAGGHIRNIAVAAAFLAAEAGSEIQMAHVIKATGRELEKMGRVCVEADFGRYYPLVAAA